MPTPDQEPTDPRPDMAPTSASPATPDEAAENAATVTPADQAPDQAAATPPSNSSQPTSTQQNMGDGAGIRGDYGNASQTNGLEGGPDRAGQPQTDTELTGS